MTEILLIGDATETMRARLAAQFTIHELADMADPLAWLKAHGANIRYVATNGHVGIKSEYVEAMPNLTVISCYGVGYDAIDTTQAVSRGIWVTHTPNVLNAEVATTALMLMLACYCNLLADDAYVRSGKWQTDGNAPLTRTADNRTVGIVGLGRIGQAIADKLAPFGAKILYHARNKKTVDYTYYSDLTAMARDSEVLICITPGGPSTQKLVNADVINA